MTEVERIIKKCYKEQWVDDIDGGSYYQVFDKHLFAKLLLDAAGKAIVESGAWPDSRAIIKGRLGV